MIIQIIFYIFASLTVISALSVIMAKNPVYSVLFLILAFFSSAGIFILLGAEFVAMLLIIVYVGAVAVLFLFVVMMLNINFEEMRHGFLKYLPFGILLALVLMVDFYLVFEESVPNIAVKATNIHPDITNTEAIGMVLYTDYIYHFQLSGLILLVAMIGAIVLTHRNRDGVRKQVISEQLSRNPLKTVEIVKVEFGKGIE